MKKVKDFLSKHWIILSVIPIVIVIVLIVFAPTSDGNASRVEELEQKHEEEKQVVEQQYFDAVEEMYGNRWIAKDPKSNNSEQESSYVSDNSNEIGD